MLERTGRASASGCAAQIDGPGNQHLNDDIDEHTTLSLKNELAELERLGEVVAAFGARCAWPSSVVQDVELALDEVVTNIISYAWDDDGRHDIHVRLQSSIAAITVEVEDDGRPFDPVTAPEAVTSGAAHERPIGGLGWYLVRSVMDELAYRRESGHNIVTMRKHAKAAREVG